MEKTTMWFPKRSDINRLDIRSDINTFLINVFTALKGSQFKFLFCTATEAG